MTKTLPASSGRALASSFKENQEDPTIKLLTNPLDPSSKNKPEMGCAGSSTNVGSDAPSSPDEFAGPDKPIVA